jgi:hypothetical protein
MQARTVSGTEPVLVGPRAGVRLSGPKLDAFRASEQLTPMGLDGFWRYTAERLFVLEAHMLATGMRRCLHIESDVLLYAQPAGYADWLERAYDDGIAACRLTDTEDTAAVMYVGSVEALGRLTEGLLELVRTPPAEIMASHGGEMAHEMRMLHLLRTRSGLSRALPGTPEEARDLGAPLIFDAGSYGQYVDGWYWEPGLSYVSERHLIGTALGTGRYDVHWDTRRQQPLVVEGDTATPLANLHVHSKRLDLWTTEDRPPPGRPAGLPGASTARARIARARTRVLVAGSRLRRGRRA